MNDYIHSMQYKKKADIDSIQDFKKAEKII